MKIIVGLGNPGKEYENTKHNLGFMFLDFLNKNYLGGEFKTFKNSKIIEGNIDNEKVILAKPQTYMNLSGEAVVLAVNYYKINMEDILIVHDDLDLPVGKLRIRKQGSGGGQKGMKNIIDLLHTNEISRIRVGIDHDERIPVVDYVLGKVKKEDLDDFNESIIQASNACRDFMDTPIDRVMNKYNKNDK